MGQNVNMTSPDPSVLPFILGHLGDAQSVSHIDPHNMTHLVPDMVSNQFLVVKSHFANDIPS